MNNDLNNLQPQQPVTTPPQPIPQVPPTSQIPQQPVTQAQPVEQLYTEVTPLVQQPPIQPVNTSPVAQNVNPSIIPSPQPMPTKPKKKNTLIIILAIIVTILGIYIGYDKFFNQPTKVVEKLENTEETKQVSEPQKEDEEEKKTKTASAFYQNLIKLCPSNCTKEFTETINDKDYKITYTKSDNNQVKLAINDKTFTAEQNGLFYEISLLENNYLVISKSIGNNNYFLTYYDTNDNFKVIKEIQSILTPFQNINNNFGTYFECNAKIFDNQQILVYNYYLDENGEIKTNNVATIYATCSTTRQ